MRDDLEDWNQAPRERILALFESYTDIVLELDDVLMQRLRGIILGNETAQRRARNY